MHHSPQSLVQLAALLGMLAAFPMSATDFSYEVRIRGPLVAYGTPPHLVWMIRDENGKLYYPAGSWQDTLPRLPPLTYWWIGFLDPPVTKPGIPRNEGSFKVLRWSLDVPTLP